MRIAVHRYRTAFTAAFCVPFLLAACGQDSAPSDYVARVGDHHLLREEIDRALRNLPVTQDSVDARQQIVEQWITNELLHQEAQRRGLRQEPEVRRSLEESERAVLVNALVTQFYEEHPIAPTSTELQAYFENHKEQLRLRESFARVRYLRASSERDAEAARDLLQQASPGERDSVWAGAIERHASDPALSEDISATYFPESRIFVDNPPVRAAMSRLVVGQIAPVIEAGGSFHVIQLVERIPARTIPEPEWIEDELVQRLVIQGRKQLYAREVQRLRNEALAREDLEIR